MHASWKVYKKGRRLVRRGREEQKGKEKEKENEEKGERKREREREGEKEVGVPTVITRQTKK